jgi:hypothetical protein
MTCIKTGCVVYLQDYGEWIYGDAFSYGSPSYLAERNGVLLIRVVLRTRNVTEIAQFGNVRHFTVTRVREWWDEDKTSMQQNSSLISTNGNWQNHGYDGIPEPQLPDADASLVGHPDEPSEAEIIADTGATKFPDGGS